MHVNSSLGNFFNKFDKAVAASNPINGGQSKDSLRPEAVKNEPKITPEATNVMPIGKQNSLVSNQVANPARQGVDVTA